MKRRIVSVLVTAMLATSLLAGCGSSGTGSSGSGGSGQSSNDSSAEAESEEGYSTEIDMDEEPYTVAIQIVAMPGTDYSDSLEEREEAINAITVPAINCKVDIQEVWISELANTTSLGVAGNEKIDLVAVGTVQPLSSMVGSEMLLDMNEGNLLQNRGPVLMDLFSDTLESGNVSGKQLAVPARVYAATAKGIFYNKTMADNAGVTLGDHFTMDELEEALIQIHEYDPSVYPFYMGDGTLNYMYWLYPYETFGSESSYGIVWDVENNPTIENLYATDEFADYCVRMQRWNELGLQPGDPTDTTTAQDYFASQQLFCVVASVTPDNKVTFSSDDFELGYSIMTDAQLANSDAVEYMWGIAASCERPDKAMDFLNYIYENADVANILRYGVEGTNYEYLDGSDRVIVSNDTYNPGFCYLGNTAEMLIQYPAGEDYVEQFEELNESASISPLLGYMFDDSDYQTESSVIDSTISQYLPQLQNGMAGSEEGTLELIDEFVTSLEASGINDVIAANQEQLDAFLAQ